MRVVARAEIGAYVSASTTCSIVVLEDRAADAPMRAACQDAHAPPVADALALVAQFARGQHLLDVADQVGRPRVDERRSVMARFGGQSRSVPCSTPDGTVSRTAVGRCGTARVRVTTSAASAPHVSRPFHACATRSAQRVSLSGAIHAQRASRDSWIMRAGAALRVVVQPLGCRPRATSRILRRCVRWSGIG
jgi:hypothetical protein